MVDLLRQSLALALASATLLMGMPLALTRSPGDGQLETAVAATGLEPGFASEACGEAAEEDRHEESKWKVNLFAAATVAFQPCLSATAFVDRAACQGGAAGRLVTRSIRGPPCA